MSLQSKATTNDHWSTEAYKNAAGFVPKLTTTVLRYLDPRPDDTVLDIGCGDGILTAQIAAELSGTGNIHGLDSSQSFIDTAKSTNQPLNCSYTLQDCTLLANYSLINGSWDKVFSNAALHWILRNEETRQSVFDNIYRALKPGGMFVFEMGGKGNVAEVHAVLLSALITHGVSVENAREVSPWFFPSPEWCTSALKSAGFSVERCELEYRPTRLTDIKDGGGLEGWIRLMGAQFLEAVDEATRDSVVRHVCAVLDTVITREEDDSQWIGYVRLRAVAKKT